MIKQGVKLIGLQPQIVLAYTLIRPIFESYGTEAVITSISDSKHSKTSRHYIGYGMDIRTRELDETDIPKVLEEIKRLLGNEFYIAFETNHFHIQWNGTPN